MATQMEREDVVLSEVSQAQRDRWPLLSLLCADGNAGPPAAESGTMITRCWGLRGRAGVVISESPIMGSRRDQPWYAMTVSTWTGKIDQHLTVLTVQA